MKRKNYTVWNPKGHKAWEKKWKNFDKESYFEAVHLMLDDVKKAYYKKIGKFNWSCPWIRIYSEPRLSWGYRTKVWTFGNTKKIYKLLKEFNSKYEFFKIEMYNGCVFNPYYSAFKEMETNSSRSIRITPTNPNVWDKRKNK